VRTGEHGIQGPCYFEMSKVSFTVNGKAYNLKLDTRNPLLDSPNMEFLCAQL
jgi:hypothetical protein